MFLPGRILVGLVGLLFALFTSVEAAATCYREDEPHSRQLRLYTLQQ